jgi:hypothetical protein
MSGRVLDFKAYLGGADNVQIKEDFPSSATTYRYDYGGNIANYSFELSSQTIVIDTLAYDRNTGEPNFSNATVVGYFANTEIDAANVNVVSTVNGTVDITIPSQLYTGNIVPDARANVPINVVSVKWTDAGLSPTNTQSHRWAIIQRWEPDVTPGNPRDEAGFTAL